MTAARTLDALPTGNCNGVRLSLSPATILLGHGSSDPAWSIPIRRLRERLCCAEPLRAFEIAFMEGGSPSLREAIAVLARTGSSSIAIAPVFMSSGGPHMRRDVPALIEEARKLFPELSIELLGGALGEAPEVMEGMASAVLHRLNPR